MPCCPAVDLNEPGTLNPPQIATWVTKCQTGAAAVAAFEFVTLLLPAAVGLGIAMAGSEQLTSRVEHVTNWLEGPGEHRGLVRFSRFLVTGTAFVDDRHRRAGLRAALLLWLTLGIALLVVLIVRAILPVLGILVAIVVVGWVYSRFTGRGRRRRPRPPERAPAPVVREPEPTLLQRVSARGFRDIRIVEHTLMGASTLMRIDGGGKIHPERSDVEFLGGWEVDGSGRIWSPKGKAGEISESGQLTDEKGLVLGEEGAHFRIDDDGNILLEGLLWESPTYWQVYED